MNYFLLIFCFVVAGKKLSPMDKVRLALYEESKAKSLGNGALNLVNRKTKRSLVNRPMTLARGLRWSYPTREFGKSHVINEEIQTTRNCETISSYQSFVCFNKTDAYYSWEDGLPVSSPLTCNFEQKCHLKAEWSFNATVKSNLQILPIDKLQSVVTKRMDTTFLASSLPSHPMFQASFRGPNTKVLVTKTLFYTIAGNLEVYDPDSASKTSLYYTLDISFPVRLKDSNYADGVFYLDDE
ncbi:hypothetical protein DSO57_1013343 [Entomophthora muscae]|uniref:Uncharacterized protein n=1 Tax=Entomophthora muscae TaxID=34485 RepID=A0ACC2UR39_9FUNG|nr:hypothetical protein DSO57_1013343 [Entomophthora muscae]